MASLLPIRETIAVNPNVEIQVREGRRLVRTIRAHNLVVNSGLDKLRDLIGYPDPGFDPAGKTPAYMAIGTGATAAAATDTTLGTEVFRKLITARYPQTHGIEFLLDLQTSEANGNTLTEIGLFSESADGILWSRCVHTAITKTALVTVSYRWTWTFGAP